LHILKPAIAIIPEVEAPLSAVFLKLFRLLSIQSKYGQGSLS